MEVWAVDYIDLVVPGFIEFRNEEHHVMEGAPVDMLPQRHVLRAAGTVSLPDVIPSDLFTLASNRQH